MQPWRSAITATEPGHIRVRGYEVTELMSRCSFAEMIYLLHKGELPPPGVGRLLNAILVAGADHGPGSPSAMTARTAATGNRRGIEAAIAAGVLAIGDAHGGAGADCMELIGRGLALVEQDGLSMQEAAHQIVSEIRRSGGRLPGLGHRVHKNDPRTTVLFNLAEEAGVAGIGVAFLQALAQEANRQIKELPINVDGAIAGVLYDLGFPPLFGRSIFILSRAAGLSAQVLEEYQREKPVRIHLDYDYDGPAPRSLTEEE